MAPVDRKKQADDIVDSFNAKYHKGKKFAISFEVTEDNVAEHLMKFFFNSNPAIPGLHPITLHFDDNVDKESIKQKLREFIETL